MKIFSSITFFIIAIFLMQPSEVCASDYPACNISKEHKLHFSSQTSTDTLSVSVIGKPCYQAKLSISISNPSGKKIYNYEAPFKKHIVINWADPKLDLDALKFVNRTIKSAEWGNSSSLPKWEAPEDFYEQNYTSVKVEKNHYNFYREQNLPVFWHLNHYEGWRHIIFDTKMKSSVVLLEGGL